MDASTVVWCTGFRQDFGWIDLPVVGTDGWPLEYRGEVADAPGLFFCGLCFQSTAASMTIHGAGRDAAHVARLIEGRRGAHHRTVAHRGLTDPAVRVRRPRRGGREP